MRSDARTLVLVWLQALAMMRHALDCVLPEGAKLSINVMLRVGCAVLADTHCEKRLERGVREVSKRTQAPMTYDEGGCEA